MIKVTLEELNDAYAKVKTEAEKKQVSQIEVVISRDPLILQNLKRLYFYGEEFPIVVTLKFEFDYSIGVKGRWIVVSNIDVIDLDR